MREIDLAFDTGADFLEAYSDEQGEGEFFIAAPLGEDPPDVGKVGTVLAANIYLAEQGLTYRIHLRLNWRRTSGDKRLVPGLGFGFLDDEHDKRDMLLRLADGDADAWLMRKAPRYRVTAKIKLKDSARSITGTMAVELSETGLCVPTKEPFPAGTEMRITLTEPHRFSLLGTRIGGRVIWSRRSGAEPAMGIEFRDTSSSTRQKMAKLITKLRAAKVGG